jgi:hypothetical protein
MVQALEAVSCSLHVNPGAVLPTRRFFHRKLAVVSSPGKENRLPAVFTHWQLIQLVNDRRTSATDQLAQDHRRGFGSVLHREEAESV